MGSGGEGEAVSPGSRIFHAPGFEYYVIAIIGVKTRIDPQVVKQGLIDTLLNHPRFSSILVPTTVFSLILSLFLFDFVSLPDRQKQCDVVRENGVCFGQRMYSSTSIDEYSAFSRLSVTVYGRDLVSLLDSREHILRNRDNLIHNPIEMLANI